MKVQLTKKNIFWVHLPMQYLQKWFWRKNYHFQFFCNKVFCGWEMWISEEKIIAKQNKKTFKFNHFFANSWQEVNFLLHFVAADNPTIKNLIPRKGLITHSCEAHFIFVLIQHYLVWICIEKRSVNVWHFGFNC